MLISDITWDDYGLDADERHRLRAMMESGNYTEYVRAAADITCPAIAEWLIESVTNRLTFEDVEFSKGQMIPMSRTYFYGYRRKMYFIFSQMLPHETQWSIEEDNEGQLTIFEL